MRLIDSAEEAFTNKILAQHKNNPRLLFETFANLASPGTQTVPTVLTPDDFADHFYSKPLSVRESIPDLLPINIPIPNPDSIESFTPTDARETMEVLATSKKTTCPFDPIPSKLYSSLPSTLPYIVNIFNLSISSGIVPCSFKKAAIRPLLKKPQLDPNCLSNYRAISRLPFLSKGLERIMSTRLIKRISDLGIDEALQSGFKAFHSPERHY